MKAEHIRKTLKLTGVALALASFAQSVFAQDYWKGYTAYLKRDYATALKEWLPLAEQGNAGVQTNLGVMYQLGEGVPKDFVESAKWYRLAAKQGDHFSQFLLGGMYERGEGVPADNTKAVNWYRLSAEGGYALAQNDLGTMYAKGDGVPQDYALAYMWFNLAATSVDAAKSNRDKAADLLPPELLAEAQRMSRLCLESNYQTCGY